MTNVIKKYKLLAILISILVFLIGFIAFFRVKNVHELENTINDINYGGTVVINAGKNYSSMPYVYYFKDTAYNSSDARTKPIRLVKYKVNKNNKISSEKIVYWPYKEFFLLTEELNQLPKFYNPNKCLKCIIIRDYKTTYYTNLDDVKKILEKYLKDMG